MAGLVAGRERVELEAEVELDGRRAPRRWSRPKEVVAPDADPVEVYECKFQGRGVDQADVDELADIDRTARSLGLDCHATIALMASYETLKAARPRLRLTAPLYFSELDDLLDLRYRASQRRVV